MTKNKKITIDSRDIGRDFPPYVIAELSANHNGSIERAFDIIKMAKNAGADAIKLQTYTADTITLNSDKEEFRIEGGLWGGHTLHSLYDWAHTPFEWHKDLFEFAGKQGITCFSSPFDSTAIDLLEDLNAPAYKIASFEAIDLPLIKYAASTGKPMIISTGMANADEISEAVQTAHDHGCQDVAILHCVSAYPAPPEDFNLRVISDMQERYGVVTGLSDHTLSNTTAIASIALGASIVEKHVTADRSGGGPDDSFSLEYDELKSLCEQCLSAWQALGSVDYSLKSSEKGNLKYRRSLYFVEALKAGDVIQPHHVRSVRPGFGLPPKHFEKIIGCRVKQDIEPATATSLDLIDVDLDLKPQSST